LSAPEPGHKPDDFASRIAGTWKLLSMRRIDRSTGVQTDLWGACPVGLLTYTADGRMSAVITSASRSISADTASDAPINEQAMLFRTSIAYAGSYSPTDSGMVHHVEVASDPALVGQDQIRFASLAGDTLVVTGPPLQTVSDPNPAVMQLVWERIG
jgi:hypothetical protein